MQNTIDYKGLVGYLFWSELKADLNGYLLGPVWWILEPCLYVAVFYFAFAHMRGDGEHVYSLLCGITIWQWIAGIINQGANSVSRKRGILQNFNIHPATFPFVSALVNSFKFLIILGCVIVFFAYRGALHTGSLLDMIAWLSIAFVVCFSYALFFSVFIPFAPDLQILISRAMMLLMFLSGVIFPLKEMSDNTQKFLIWNPLAHIIEGGRQLFIYGESLDYSILTGIAVVHLALLLLAFWLLGKLRGEIPKRLV